MNISKLLTKIGADTAPKRATYNSALLKKRGRLTNIWLDFVPLCAQLLLERFLARGARSSGFDALVLAVYVVSFLLLVPVSALAF